MSRKSLFALILVALTMISAPVLAQEPVEETDQAPPAPEAVAAPADTMTFSLSRGTTGAEDELAFQEELAGIAAAGHFDFVYVPSVSRPGAEQGREAVGRGRTNNILRLILGLPMAEEQALEEARKGGSDTRDLEEAVARAVTPQLPPGLDFEALRARLDPASTVVLTCGSPGPMGDVRRVAEGRGMRVEREEW